MPGRAPWGASGTKGSGETIAVNNRPGVEIIDLSQTETVDAGSGQISELYAPEGSIYQVLSFRATAPNPTGSSDGQHRFSIYFDTGFGLKNDLTEGVSYAGTNVKWNFSGWTEFDEANPSNQAAQAALTSKMKATDSEPLVFFYDNQTDVQQTEKRTLYVAVEEVSY